MQSDSSRIDFKMKLFSFVLFCLLNFNIIGTSGRSDDDVPDAQTYYKEWLKEKGLFGGAIFAFRLFLRFLLTSLPFGFIPGFLIKVKDAVFSIFSYIG
ncbi:hypothetical protein WA026_000417 [Henosepilachna vigintioctopunctata]|uniref:Uncharacterized protein n=1 Tax=Henosepilachna vigintioctopunctata TaxID=420089 RepID=A0AAW1V447_9CUCU